MPELARAYVSILPDASTFRTALNSELASQITNVVIPARFDINSTAINEALRDQSINVTANTAGVDAAATRVTDDFRTAAAESGQAIEREITGGANTAGSSIGRLSTAFQTAAGYLGAIAAQRVFSELVGGISSAISSASDLNENISKTNVIFASASDIVLNFSKTTATAFGISRNAALEAAATFGVFFNQIGATSEEAARMSISLVAVAGDLASFFNISTSDALEKLRAGLTGEVEPLRAVGVFLTENAVKEKAYALGIAERGDALSEGQKIMARYELILQQTGIAQGDFERTSQGVANQQRILSATLADLGTNLGAILLPVVNAVVSVLNDLAGGLVSLTDRFGILDEAQRNSSGAVGDLNLLYENLGLTAALVGSTLGKLSGITDESAAAILKAVSNSGAYEKAQQGVVSAVEAYNKAATGAANATDLAAQKTAFAKDHAEALQKAHDALTTATAKVHAAETAYADSLDNVAAKQRAVQDAIADRDEIQAKLNTAIGQSLDQDQKYQAAVANLADKQRDLLEAENDVKVVEQQYSDAKKDAEVASKTYADAQEHLALIQRGYGADSREAAAATRDLHSAQLGAKSAELDLADAKDRLAAAELKAAQAGGANAAANRELERARIAVENAELRVADANDKVTKAQSTQNEVINGASEGSKALADARALVAAADGKRATAVEKVNAFEGEFGKLADANQKVSEQRALIDQARVKIAEAEAAHNAAISKLKDQLLAADEKIQTAEDAAAKARDASKLALDKIALAKDAEHDLADKIKALEKETFDNRADKGVGSAEDILKAQEGIEESVRKQALAYVDQQEKIAAISGVQLTSTEKLRLYNEKLSEMGANTGPGALKDAIGTVQTQVQALTAEAIKPIPDSGASGYKATLLDLGNAAKTAALNIPFIADAVKALSPVLGSLGGVFETVKAAFSSGLEALTAFWNTFGETITRVVVTVFGGIIDYVDAIFRQLQGVFQIFTGILTGDWSKAWEGVKNVVGGVIDAAKAVFGTIGQVLLDIVSGLGPKLLDVGENVIDGIKEGIDAAWPHVVDFFKNLPANIRAAAGDLTAVLVGAAGALINGLRNAIVAAFPAVASFFASIDDRIRSAAGDLTNVLVGAAGALMRGMANAFSSAFGPVASFFQGIPGRIRTAVGDLTNALTGAAGSLVGGFFNKIEDAWVKVTGFFSGVQLKLGNIGAAIGAALGNGIKGAINLVIGLINKMINYINNLEFKLPRVSIKGTGISIGGQTIGLGPSIPSITPLARGGDALGQQLHLVGEEGPELFVPERDGYVMTHADTRRLLAALETGPADAPFGSGSSSVQHAAQVNISVPDPAWADIIADRVVRRQAAVFGRIRT